MIHKLSRGVVLVLSLFLLFSVFVSAAIADYVVISEFLVTTAGSENGKTFIELYNPTNEDINIGDWDIAYESATFSSWTKVAEIPASSTIPAHGYFLIGGDLVEPTPDLNDTSLGFNDYKGHIAVRNATDGVIDWVGYGAASDPEGTNTSAPPKDQTAERKSSYTHNENEGNGWDTNNNSADFFIQPVPNPQNSSNATEHKADKTVCSDPLACDYTTIQAAIDASSAGDTINVSDGTYNAASGETFPILVNVADLTIKSTNGTDVTFISPIPTDLAGFHVTASGVTIGGSSSGFTILPGGRGGIYADETGGNRIVVQGNIFKSDAPGERRGMWFEKLSNGALISGNSFAIPMLGTGIQVVNAEGATISDNTVTTGTVKYSFLTFKAEAFYPDRDPPNPYAEYVATTPSTIKNVSVTGNSITGMDANRYAIRFAASTKGADHGQPQAQDLTVDAAGVNISGNVFTSNGIGVGIDENKTQDAQIAHIAGVENILINFNNFDGNTMAVENEQAAAVDSTYNYWGDATGPGGAGPGTGDNVTANVSFIPWMNSPFDVAPDVTLSVPAYTNNPVLTIGLSAVNVPDEMRFSLDNSAWSGWIGWGNSATSSYTINITNTTLGGNSNDGLKTIYAQVRDYAGNTASNDNSTTYDTIIPSLTNASIASNNADAALAKVGDTVTITIVANENLQAPTVTIDSNAADSVVQGADAQHWTATRVMQAGDTEGAIAFTIDFTDLAGNPGTQATATTDSSSVVFDETIPSLIASSIEGGYNNYFSPNGDGSFDSINIVMNSSEPVDWGTTNIYNSTNDLINYSADDSTSFVTSDTVAWDGTITGGGNVPDGDYTVATTITDQAGNVNTSIQLSLTIIVDNTAPATTDNAPAGWQNESFTITLTPTDSSSGVDYTNYSIDGGAYKTNTSILINTDGNYTVIYYSVDNAGNVEAINTIYAALDTTAPVVNAGIDQNVNEGSLVTLNGSSSTDATSGIVSYSWDFDSSDGIQVNATGATASTTYNVNGTYVVTLTLTDDAGNSGTDELNVAVLDLSPTVDFGINNTNPRENKGSTVLDLVAFTDNSTSAPDSIVSRYWDFGDGTNSSDTNPTHSYELNGTHTVTLTVTDSDASTGSFSQDIDVSFIDDKPLSIGTFPTITLFEDTPLKYNLTDPANGGYFTDEEDLLSYTIGGLDENVDVIVNGNIATITPAKNWYGTVTGVHITASDGVNPPEPSNNLFNITVNSINDKPVIDIAAKTIQEDSAAATLDLSLNTTDVETASIALTYTATPEDENKVNCSVQGYTLTYKPAADWFGPTYCDLTASDGENVSDVLKLDITVENINDAPTITSTAKTTATQDIPYSYQVIATDKDNTVVPGIDTLKYSLTTKPAGMGIDPSGPSGGLIVWLPGNSDVGQHNVKVNVSDGKGGFDTQSFVVTVSNANDAPSVPVLTSPASGATIIIDSAILKWDASTDDDGDSVTYYVYHSNESDNIITYLGSTNLLNYTATGLNDLNNYYWYVVAGDVNGGNSTASTTFNYAVSLHNPPNITSFSPEELSPSVVEGGSLAFSVTAEDVDGDTPLTYLWKFDSDEVSTTSSYSYNSLFNHSGTHTVDVLVNDTTGMTDSMSWSVTVNNTNREPVFGIIVIPEYTEDSETIFTISASDEDIQFGDSLTFSLNDTRLILKKISETSATLNWTPKNSDVGVNYVNVTVKDNFGGQDSEIITITVVNTNDAPRITGYYPKYNPAMAEDESQKFNVTYEDDDIGDTAAVTWLRNGTNIGEGGSIAVSGLAVGNYNITATVTDSKSASDKQSWILKVSDRPVTEKYSGSLFNIPKEDLGTAKNVTITESSFGGIDFGTNELDLIKVIDIDGAVLIDAGKIGIDTQRYPQLNKSAHIVMKGLSFETEPVIYYDGGFGVSGNTVCPSDLCTNVDWDSNTGILEFDVSHFSTYFVTTNNRPTANAGSDRFVRAADGVITLDGSASSDPDNDTLTYQWAQVSGLGVSLSSTTAEKPTFTANDGTYIFQLIVNDGTVDSSPDNVTVTVFGSVLSIDKVTLKSYDKDGELKPGEDLTVKVKVENNGDFDIEDIELKIWFVDSSGHKLEDDDNDDIEEEEEFDLDDGDSETTTFEFTGMPMDVEDGDKYTVHVIAEGRNADNHTITYLDIDESKTIEFVRESHELEIFRAVLTPDIIKCSRSVNLETGVRNLGEREEDVTLTVSNSQLGLNKAESFELSEDLDDEDSENEVSFSLLVGEDIESGLYPITVRADYGSKSETKVLNLEVKDCEKVVEKKEDVFVEKKEPVVTIKDAKKEEVAKETVTISFRDSSAYLILLVNTFILLTGLLILLAGAAVVMWKKR